ncbi:MAG: alpha/beta hydrolase [Treponema sp.]|nr:alpha/beta hydrolase [Treponema sp.]
MIIKIGLCIAAAALLFAVLGISLSPVFFFYYIIKRKDIPAEAFLRGDKPDRLPGKKGGLTPALPPWIDRVERQLVEISSHDGLLLRGYYLACRDAAGRGSPYTVILAHGYTGNGKQLSSFAEFYYRDLGFNILMPHARAHGASEGAYIGFGWLDRLDYLRWIDWALSRTKTGASGGGAGIVLHGVSMGAATVMITAGEAALPDEVLAVVEDCGYSSLEDELYAQMQTRYHIRSSRLMKATSRISKSKAAYAFEEVSPLERIRRVKIPVLFIHGDADRFVPFSMVHTLYEACPASKELFVVSGARHAEAFGVNPEEYQKRVIQFVQKAIARGDRITAGAVPGKQP